MYCILSLSSFFFSFPAHLAPSLFGFFVFFFDVHRPFYLNYAFLSSKQKKKCLLCVFYCCCFLFLKQMKLLVSVEGSAF